MNKKGLSPVIATSLLIAIGLVLAIIIFLWARSFIVEKIQKDLGGGPQPIEFACEEVNFEVDATVSGSSITVDLENKGNVPIYGVEVRKKNVGAGSVKSVNANVATTEDNLGVRSGETKQIAVGSSGTSFSNNDRTLLIVPILMGETSKSDRRAYPCEKYAQQVDAILL